VLIVDDEDPARELLREYLGREAGVEVVGECRNGFEAVKAVAELRPTSSCSTSRCPSSRASRCWS
jgi:two-component system LytT family response regulator